MTIVNGDILHTARLRWHGSNRDFDRAARELEYATSQTDVIAGLPNPPFTLKSTVTSHSSVKEVVEICVDSKVMLRYYLTEVGPEAADVEIIV